MAENPWKDKDTSKQNLKERLTPIQFKVTQKNGTEPPFANPYWDNKGPGIYVDIVSGEPLFDSQDKFDSGTGWPSFTRPIEPDNIVERTDRTLWSKRTEVRSRRGDSHLGHVFDGGPAPTGKRYCINSASLRFIPLAKLEEEGYGSFLGGIKENPGSKLKKATFAGGCFWCMEPPFEALEGVVDVVAGYAGGDMKDATYREVSAGRTRHAESVQVTYDPSKIGYDRLLHIFWRNIDPTTLNRQFVDVGTQYRTGIFVHDDEQKKLAQASLEKLESSGRYKKPIVTKITAFAAFYPAEDYHQDYHKKNPIRYKYYRFNSGRDRYLKKIWGK